MQSLPIAGGDPVEKLLRTVCSALDAQLRGGGTVRAEQCFASHPILATREELAVELIYTEYVACEELGRRPTSEEFLARFPQWRQALERQFRVHDLIRTSLQNDFQDGVPESDAVRPQPRRWLGSYELLDEVARGGCGIVYRALQHGLDRIVAVKLLRPEYGRLLRARQRFCHEARVMAALRHPNIIPVHDISESDGIIYFSMDFVTGGSLASQISQRPWATVPAPRDGEMHPLLRERLQLLAVVARAIHYAHGQGVVHCDLKPSNILLDGERGPLVSDFGLARLPTSDTEPEGEGEIVGTPAYMAPEQVDGRPQPLTPATDIWALGIILYEILLEKRPFRGSALETLRQILAFEDPIYLREPGSERELAIYLICQRCLQRRPEHRYATAQEFADALTGVLLES